MVPWTIAAGVGQIKVVVSFSAIVVCSAEAVRYWLSAAQVALMVHVPVPEVIVTVAPLPEQGPLAVITAVLLAFVAAVTVKVD